MASDVARNQAEHDRVQRLQTECEQLQHLVKEREQECERLRQALAQVQAERDEFRKTLCNLVGQQFPISPKELEEFEREIREGQWVPFEQILSDLEQSGPAKV